MSNAFEYGDALLPQPESSSEPGAEASGGGDGDGGGDGGGGDDSRDGGGEDTPRPRIESNQPYLNLAT
jgi:hypothetical protein